MNPFAGFVAWRGESCVEFTGARGYNVGLQPIRTFWLVERGGKLTVRKFDTDVGAQYITYTCSSMPNKSWSGIKSANGQFATDVIDLPSDYTEGTWYANYAAGANDTSVWNMSYSNAGPGTPGYIKLVR